MCFWLSLNQSSAISQLPSFGCLCSAALSAVLVQPLLGSADCLAIISRSARPSLSRCSAVSWPTLKWLSFASLVTVPRFSAWLTISPSVVPRSFLVLRVSAITWLSALGRLPLARSTLGHHSFVLQPSRDRVSQPCRDCHSANLLYKWSFLCRLCTVAGGPSVRPAPFG